MQSKEMEFAEPRIGFVSTRIAGTDGVSLGNCSRGDEH